MISSDIVMQREISADSIIFLWCYLNLYVFGKDLVFEDVLYMATVSE